jgi:hypothetical protein
VLPGFPFSYKQPAAAEVKVPVVPLPLHQAAAAQAVRLVSWYLHFFYLIFCGFDQDQVV